ncbi:tRNA (adenosine(37)-N6)-threonylcarbamoyltransferase complex dimerization subunit type 1 TsaB [Eubacterium sp. AF15-50]|uniref:tRNA (adenosine(37)-N6)-threonylcarbamoyltransferase complex dimerization subunit type 1 TsaB n=1 Tax=unclassified Eubacterium (in: firmicutes) TaxID=2624479 RepID=UPI000E541E11|nr:MULTISPECIES: tRNA (adenosine(37)-N6)-threonylcarbamoyltransferase complex dimerization subunit type 1 TsaB [unclassified Eubacterium (in: firmicutes)]RHR69561.1 tRNA (adenosine(37)-N6)-threonylcarbamoyltransferase complex dimerization subunit type 1 TsaB [Eubacterium sp. AF16-48]RHR78750.1 tRNA (adenosine(37)-N6)-threonylcarbamoyltransferase complex dimerization subunit type 1 TsaB [Eubacterium sp. AF15-50]
MRILAIDSSSMVATVAITTDGILNAEYTINHKKTHSQTLLPMIAEIVKMIEIDMDSIDAVAITGGPGSYTGLRIGSATAKGIGLALNKPIINVPTMDALAYNLYSSQYVICPIMDARRGQVYTGIYKFEETEMKTIKPQCIMMIDELIKELDTIKESVMFLGDGVDVHKQLIDDMMDTKHYYAPASMNRHKASTLGTIAEIYYKNGKTETAKEHKPEYLRLSQAERELKAKMKEAKSDN